MNTKIMTRFGIRLSVEQKKYLEYASRLGGFNTLSDFILTSAINDADLIVARHRSLLTSLEDMEVFFVSLLYPDNPNGHLKAAVARYKRHLKKQ